MQTARSGEEKKGYEIPAGFSPIGLLQLELPPDQTELDRRKCFGPEFAVQRGLLTARFINYVEGRNQPWKRIGAARLPRPPRMKSLDLDPGLRRDDRYAVT
jgi:hypothetical protein